MALIKCLLCAIYFTLHSCILLVAHSNSRWSGWFGHFLRQSCLGCESVSQWAEATALGSGRCRSQAWQCRPLWQEPIQLRIFISSPVLWYDSRQVLYVPVTLSPKSVAAVSLVLLLESLTRCSCVGHPGWASSPLSGTWRACSRQGGSMVRGTELGLWSWDLVLNRFCHKQLCIWGQTTESGHPPASCEADIITWPTGCSRIPWASAQEAMVSGRVLFEERCIML